VPESVCLQVLLRVSVHVAISLYSVIAIVAGIMSLLLPIETKGREMAVSSYLTSVAMCHCARRSSYFSVIAAAVGQMLMELARFVYWWPLQQAMW